MFDLIVEIAKIAKQIYDAAELAKANQDQSKVLARRVLIVSEQVHTLKSVLTQQPAHYERALKQLIALLKDCKAFIIKFQEKNILSKLLFGGSHKEEFNDYNDSLQRASMDLSLGMQVNAVFNREEDRAAEAKDSQQLEKIARINQEQLKLAKQTDAKQDEILRRFEALSLPQKSDTLEVLKKRYRIAPGEVTYGAMIGEDDYSTWYHGVHLSQPVFIKRIKIVSDEVHQHFIREVAVLSRLHNQCILSFYGACFEATQHCLVMEPIEYSLSDVLTASRPIAHCIRYMKNIAASLHYLHTKDICHGDVSLHCIVLTEEGKAKLTGFGFAGTQATTVKALGAASVSQQAAWLAPERFKLAHKAPTPASDLYSLGLLLWALFTQKQPTKGVSPAAMLSELPSPLATLVGECLDANPMNRPQAVDVILRLEAIEKALTAPPLENPETRYQAGVKAEAAKDLALACSHYQAAVALHHNKAKTNLAYFFSKGLGGVPKNESKAFLLLSEAAEGGHNRAMFNLGLCYQHGKGVAIDLGLAKRWYQEALKLGYKDAKPYLEALTASFAGNFKSFS